MGDLLLVFEQRGLKPQIDLFLHLVYLFSAASENTLADVRVSCLTILIGLLVSAYEKLTGFSNYFLIFLIMVICSCFLYCSVCI